MRREDSTFIDKNLHYKFQICDINNKTTFSGYIEDINVENIYSDSGEGQSYSSYTQAYGMDFIKHSGKFRIDGYLYYQGKWRLVSQIKEITLE